MLFEVCEMREIKVQFEFILDNSFKRTETENTLSQILNLFIWRRTKTAYSKLFHSLQN
jgi:hypothetical protein